MKNREKNSNKDFLGDVNFTYNPALNNASRKGTEKKIALAKEILSKTNLVKGVPVKEKAN